MHVELLVACFRYEKAHQIIQDDRNWRYPDNPNRRHGPQRNPPHNKCDNAGEVTSSAVVTPTPKQDKQTVTDSADSRKKGRRNDGQQDAERRKRLREEGKCFQCAGTDHIQRNCPQRQQHRPRRSQRQEATLHLNALGLASPDEVRLAATQEGTQLRLFAVGTVCS